MRCSGLERNIVLHCEWFDVIFIFFFLFLRIKVESRVWILRFRREMKKSM